MKRTPQSVAKRAYEWAVPESRERKAAKKREATVARKETESGFDHLDGNTG